MSNLKISEINAAAALDGTELVEVVQDGANVKATIDAAVAATVIKSLYSTAIDAPLSAAQGKALKAALVAGLGLTEGQLNALFA